LKTEENVSARNRTPRRIEIKADQGTNNFLAAEVPIDGHPGYAGAQRNGIHAGAVEAPLEEDRFCGFQNCGPFCIAPADLHRGERDP